MVKRQMKKMEPHVGLKITQLDRSPYEVRGLAFEWCTLPTGLFCFHLSLLHDPGHVPEFVVDEL